MRNSRLDQELSSFLKHFKMVTSGVNPERGWGRLCLSDCLEGFISDWEEKL
jgi:hypothetical protein